MTQDELLAEIKALESELFPIPYSKEDFRENLEKWHSFLWELRSLKHRNPQAFEKIRNYE